MPSIPSPGTSRRLIVLGSTGSIGLNTLAVVEHLRAAGLCDFQVVGLAAGANVQVVLQQAREHNVGHIAIANGVEDEPLPASARGLRVYRGPDAALELVTAVAKPGDLVVGAMVGSAGVPATLAAIERGCHIALANKETLVAAGALVMPRVIQFGVNLLPIDSEHSAIFQCLHGEKSTSRQVEKSKSRQVEKSKSRQVDKSTSRQVEKSTSRQVDRSTSRQVETSTGRVMDASRPTDNVDFSTFRLFDMSSVARVVLTASGGPFRTWPRQRMENATVEEALNHPTWNMGPKVTIDSASLMNKALEIIEAHWLFEMPSSKIDVVIHPQSIIHSLVEFVDGSVLAQLGPPDMKTPIQYALTWPARVEGCSMKMDWTRAQRLEFEPVDGERFRAPRLAHQVIEAGGTSGAIFNAANESAVTAFLDRRISFGRIVALVEQALESVEVRPVHTLDDVVHADQAARRFVNEKVAACGVAHVER